MHELTARQPKRVLLVEDDPEFARLTQIRLEQPVADVRVGDTHQSACICGQWIVFCVGTLSAGGDALRNNAHPFDVILLDMILPDGGREGAVTIIKEAAPDVPIVVQSGLNDLELVSTLLVRNEISDYIVKDGFMSPAALKQTICHAIDVFHTKRAGEEFARRMNARAESKNLNGESRGETPALEYSGQGL